MTKLYEVVQRKEESTAKLEVNFRLSGQLFQPLRGDRMFSDCCDHIQRCAMCALTLLALAVAEVFLCVTCSSLTDVFL